MPSLTYFEGKFMPASEAKVGVMTHALHYGTAVFEGIRGNWNPEEQQIYIFRLREHYERLLKGCRVLKINLPYTLDDLIRVTVELVAKCGLQEDIYIRPLAWKSSQVIGVLKLHELKDDFLALVIPFGNYLDVGKGARCCVSSWRRIDDNMIPPRVKVSGLYVNSVLAKTAATESGFDEAIMLNQDGHVSEGTGENIFLVTDGKLATPSVSDNILPGITRDCVIKLAKNELNLETVERSVDRSELYLAEECFLTGTAAHITPVVEIDHRKVGDGEIGAITQQLQDLYFEVVRGRSSKYRHWCTPVFAKVRA